MMFDGIGMKIILHEGTALGYIYMYIRKVCDDVHQYITNTE